MSRSTAKNLRQFEMILMNLQDLNQDQDPDVCAFIAGMKHQIKRDINETSVANAMCVTTRNTGRID